MSVFRKILRAYEIKDPLSVYSLQQHVAVGGENGSETVALQNARKVFAAIESLLLKRRVVR